MHRPVALIVDDEPDILELLQITLDRMGIDSRPAADLQSARALLREARFDICLTDMRLPDGDGIELVELISQTCPGLPVAVITAHGNMESAIHALKAGAFDFASKPIDLEMLRRLIQSALKLEPQSAAATTGQPPDAKQDSPLLGRSPAMARLRALIHKLARSQAPVFIGGESGSGKELAARQIHAESPRREAPFVPVNCGAIPQELMESEFFGHRKGSFTGATGDKPGLFQAADGGTLFLDEVADLPLSMQVKLLRAIQEKRIRPIGAAREIPLDVRIISATHQDLPALVSAGAFRQDLFYRIHVIELQIPSLRERPEDIPLLARHILQRLAVRNGVPAPEIGDAAMQRLQAYHYPGNIRELENILERAITLCEGRQIGSDDILLPDPPGDRPEADRELPLEGYLEAVERDAITRALEATRWNRTEAAKRLGLSFRQLRYRLKKLGID